ncbi:hypothetical protein BDV38DRAFT_237301 [Aspergillus pseudotamarii]|uniref:Uncharacterized protein n=1 Tax=Aspergillus pseudotamarii TaxID=132259 RepID=A0A5N6T5S2_ASPPS|nr:uncharacterized protein BDV38DRAFT_237301 [Aspergillus pseudotamarii]KAE8141666.1 hypothetical protein BDV38DRAFT_237301 [Aspergillus pseudotamarii]
MKLTNNIIEWSVSAVPQYSMRIIIALYKAFCHFQFTISHILAISIVPSAYANHYI